MRRPTSIIIALTALTLTALLSTACNVTAGTETGVPADLEEPVDGGQLTAGVWDDNRNYDAFLAFLEKNAQLEGALAIPQQDRDAAHEEFAGDRPPRAGLDVALLIDTTGSMGDEMEYLTGELSHIAAVVGERVNDVRWALVVYKDEGDEYVTRSFAFSADIDVIQSQLAEQSAGGGGDYPEADDRALEDLLQLDWRTRDDIARVAFWLGDAPHHADRAQRMSDAILATRAADVHVYPIAASGADKLTELSMRSAAQLTGGRYIFLTDDSGIGDAHAEPDIGCYFVTLLDDAMVRMLDIELTGAYREPADDEILRTVGEPVDGRCTVDDQSVAIF